MDVTGGETGVVAWKGRVNTTITKVNGGEEKNRRGRIDIEALRPEGERKRKGRLTEQTLPGRCR